MSKLKDKFKQYLPEIVAVGSTVGALTLYAFYLMGVHDGRRSAKHGPCVEVGRIGADHLLAGKSMLLKVEDRDVIFKMLENVTF